MSDKSTVDVNVSPNKQFFIESLTRDITIINCIMDLIDNSVAGAKKDKGNGDFHGYVIQIKISKNSFRIKDNCGGISVEDATNYALKFGYDINQTKSYSSSGFGIGMKRAFFKIGKDITIKSSTKEDGFIVKLDVEQWLKEEEWIIALECKSKLGKWTGTNIEIEKINPTVANDFHDNKFQHKLSKEIEKKYRDDIRHGLEIVVNSESISHKDFDQELLVETTCDYKGMSIEVKVMKSRGSAEDSGWYITLNDNVVVRANKDTLTGWGGVLDCDKDNVTWDAQRFTGFMGYVTIKARDTASLPFTTTKEINVDDDTYQFILPIMINATKECKDKFKNSDVISIQYKKKIDDVELLKKHFQVANASDVGRITFDHYLDKVKKKSESSRNKI